MGLTTGTPLGSITSQDEIYLEGAPYVYFQDYTATELSNPDADGFYWGLSGTTAYPVYLIGCATDINLTENLTVGEIRCDNVGQKDAIQKRNYLDFNLTITSLLPLTVLKHMIKGGAVTVSGAIEKMGLGSINNNLKYHVYLPKVYDEDTGDYVSITIHKAKFVDAFTLNMRSGEPWQLTGIKLRAFADDTKPAAQYFATIIRADPSDVP